MKDLLTRLTEKTATLGNYHRKYLHIISTNIDQLTASLEQNGNLDRVHLWTYSMEIPGEMDTVLESASSQEEKVEFLGCYYALQFLHMNLHMVDIIKLELTINPQRSQTGKQLMLEAGRMFRHLTKCYMDRLLNLFLDAESTPTFVILGVGTRADQDDIDLGIVHQQSEDSVVMNRAISRMSNQMFKKATRLHFHLSEHVGENSLTATIEQYEDILERGVYDFVMVTEMLGAAPILGDQSLFEEFRTRVTDRFYYDPKNKTNKYHEGYLRGILSEINSLLTHLKPVETINPKDDALRPIKGLLTALKLVYGVKKVNAWNIIDELKEKNPQRLPEYENLERTLSFFEMFRYLYQIMVAQDEDIGLNVEPIRDMVAKIAQMIGFEKKGVVSAMNFMLVIYYEFLENTVQAVKVLVGDLRNHLHAVSVYSPIFSGDIHRQPGYQGNLAVDFVRASTFSKGITYWDDFLEELDAQDNIFYNEFIQSLIALPMRLRRKVVQIYVSGTEYDPSSTLRFVVIIGRKAKDKDAKMVFQLVSSSFVENMGRFHNASEALSQFLHAYPGILQSFLALIEWEQLSSIAELARITPALPEHTSIHKQLLTLIDLHCQSSYFFKQHFYHILDKFPTYIKNLHHLDKLTEITAGFYSDLTSLPSLTDRLERLGDYYDLEFVRVSLSAMTGAGCENTDTEFIEFCDNYTHSLYEFCQEDVNLSMGYSLRTHDLFALYATGGHAREQGFDDDYDMIVLLNTNDSEITEYFNRIVARMNAHILKRGILPHHRFAGYYNSYVISFEQLADHLTEDKEDVFVDQSQILCSRMLVGSNKLERKLQQEIIAPLIFARSREYIESIKKEMKSRHTKEDPDLIRNIKECRGGLRDIEMLLLTYKVKHRERDPLSRKFLRRLIEIEPKHSTQFAYILEHLNFVKGLRDLYRLKVAAHNIIDHAYLQSVADSLGYANSTDSGNKLFSEFLARTSYAGDIIEELINSIMD